MEFVDHAKRIQELHLLYKTNRKEGILARIKQNRLIAQERKKRLLEDKP